MKKFKIIFSMTLLLLMTISSATYAATQSNKKNLRYSEYSQYYSGDKSNFCAVGQNGVAYTSLTNKSATTYYFDVYTREYVYDSGWDGYSSQTGYVNSGVQLLTTPITRYANSYIRFYLHSAKCCVSPYYSSTLDSFSFIANQYY